MNSKCKIQILKLISNAWKFRHGEMLVFKLHLYKVKSKAKVANCVSAMLSINFHIHSTGNIHVRDIFRSIALGTYMYVLSISVLLTLSGERGGSVVECRTPEREVRGSKPTAAVLCP